MNWPGETRNVLENISFEIESGSLVGVIGRVGAGKTSFLEG